MKVRLIRGSLECVNKQNLVINNTKKYGNKVIKREEQEKHAVNALAAQVKACKLCRDYLPFDPRPIIQLHAESRILIAGQAPGKKAHESGIPFADASGDRLRSWLGLTRDEFYDATKVAILPMGFCYPGTGPSGDLPPRPECAPTWRPQLLEALENIELTIVIGRYAQAWHMPGAGKTVTDVVKAWETYWPDIVPLPHPSPRNNRWLKNNPWFESDLLPVLRERVADVFADNTECY